QQCDHNAGGHNGGGSGKSHSPTPADNMRDSHQVRFVPSLGRRSSGSTETIHWRQWESVQGRTRFLCVVKILRLAKHVVYSAHRLSQLGGEVKFSDEYLQDNYETGASANALWTAHATRSKS